MKGTLTFCEFLSTRFDQDRQAGEKNNFVHCQPEKQDKDWNSINKARQSNSKQALHIL